MSKCQVRVFVVGCGMTKFEKPQSRQDFDYPQMVKESVTKALQDAGIGYESIEQACASYVYGDSTSGQRALYEVGLTGIPIYNVNNNCASGSTALILAKQLIENGNNHCILAVGFEKMNRGPLSSETNANNRTNPLQKHLEVFKNIRHVTNAPITSQMIGSAGFQHMQTYNYSPEYFAKIAYKNHKHAEQNPYAQFQKQYTLDEIKQSPSVYEFLTKLHCSPTSDGSAACILCSEDFVKKNQLECKAVEILSLEMATDLPSTFEGNDVMNLVGYEMTKLAAEKAYLKSGYRADDVQVVELHDCFSSNEMIMYEALGLCGKGKAPMLIDRGDTTYGGKYVINPSGGLIARGHPLGATGLAQCCELCWQLRNEAGDRQVKGAIVGLQHNIGLGGAAVVGLYKMGFRELSEKNVISKL